MKALSKPNLPSKTRILFPQRGKRFFSLGLALRLRRNPARFGLRDIFSDKFGLLLDFKLAKERNFPEARLEERAGMVSRPQSGRASDESQRANTLGERAVAKGNSFPCRCSMGFTMIEILVVISIMILLSSLLILYSRTGENQIILFRDQSRLITSLNMAKSLSIQRFNASSPSCAFGVHFSKTENAFLIFRDLAADCQNADHVYTDSGELFENYQLSSRIKFGETTLTDIIFTPPDPKILIDNDSNKIEATITLETLDGNASLKVKVNNAGQITTQ